MAYRCRHRWVVVENTEARVVIRCERCPMVTGCLVNAKVELIGA